MIFRVKGYLISVLACTMLCGCVKSASALEERFLEHDGLHFSVKGKTVMQYDPLSCQACFSPSPCEFKVCEDNMKDYFIIRCRRIPEGVGDNVVCDAEWTTYSDLKMKENLKFEVVKTDESSGTLWLWCQSARIGAAVCRF